MMMAGLQRSAQTFRRSGSSGLVWDERFLTECGGAGRPELRHSRSVGGATVLQRGAEAGGGHDDDDKKRRTAELPARPPKRKEGGRQKQRRQQEVVATAVRKAFRSRDVAPAAEPPSPRVPAGCCSPCAILRGSAATAGGSSSSLARRARTKQ